MTTSQFSLDLGIGFREAFTREDFLVTSSNEVAVKWIDALPDWPCHCLIVYGTDGCGKTHLAHIFKDKIGFNTPIISASSLQEENIPKLVSLSGSVAIEEVDIGVSEDNLLHLYNFTRENKGFLFITSRKNPLQWGIKLADLRSRIAGSLIVEISFPDDDFLKALIVKMILDRHLTISEEALEFMIKNIERSFKEVRRVVIEADKLSLSEHKGITIPILRKVLGK